MEPMKGVGWKLRANMFERTSLQQRFPCPDSHRCNFEYVHASQGFEFGAMCRKRCTLFNSYILSSLTFVSSSAPITTQMAPIMT